MNSGVTPGEHVRPPGTQAEFRKQLEAWRNSLARCGRKPGRKCVHNLRVATLRLQAALEDWMSSQPADAEAASAARRWRRQGKKLRRVLGPVRQADVSLDKLEQVRNRAESSPNGHEVLPKECLGALDEIERRIKRKRQAAADKLAGEIEKRRKRVNRLSRKLEIVSNVRGTSAEIAPASRIRAQIVATTSEYPVLDDENLHEFRKRIKKIRYRAEVYAAADSMAARHAAALKRMTGAVGAWHDWQALAEEAARVDDGDPAMAAAAEFLRAQADRSLQHALKLCRNSMARLIESFQDRHGPRTKSEQQPAKQEPRKPVVPVAADFNPADTARSLRAS